MLQGFINRMVRGIALKKGDGIEEMKGKMTMTDLRFQVWIGHIARRGAERREYKTLRVWLEVESNLLAAGKSEFGWPRQVQNWLTRLKSWTVVMTSGKRLLFKETLVADM